MQKPRKFYPPKKEKRPDLEYIFGIRAVMEAITAGKDFEKIFIKKDLKGELVSELKDLLGNTSIPVQKVPIEKLNRITQKNHQGVIGWASPVQYQNISDIIPTLFENGKEPLIVVLDGITDVRNFGAIARTADGAGVDAILVSSKNSAAITPDAVKTSAGALLSIPVCRTPDLVRAVKELKNSGLKVVAASEKTSDNYTTASLTGPLALVMGAEDVGVSDEILEITDQLLSIPMLGKIGSLNVSVAAGILLYEVVRQQTL